MRRLQPITNSEGKACITILQSSSEGVQCESALTRTWVASTYTSRAANDSREPRICDTSRTRVCGFLQNERSFSQHASFLLEDDTASAQPWILAIQTFHLQRTAADPETAHWVSRPSFHCEHQRLFCNKTRSSWNAHISEGVARPDRHEWRRPLEDSKPFRQKCLQGHVRKCPSTSRIELTSTLERVFLSVHRPIQSMQAAHSRTPHQTEGEANTLHASAFALSKTQVPVGAGHRRDSATRRGCPDQQPNHAGQRQEEI